MPNFPLKPGTPSHVLGSGEWDAPAGRALGERGRVFGHSGRSRGLQRGLLRPHAAIRVEPMGWEARLPTEAELQRMWDDLDIALEDAAQRTEPGDGST